MSVVSGKMKQFSKLDIIENQLNGLKGINLLKPGKDSLNRKVKEIEKELESLSGTLTDKLPEMCSEMKPSIKPSFVKDLEHGPDCECNKCAIVDEDATERKYVAHSVECETVHNAKPALRQDGWKRKPMIENENKRKMLSHCNKNDSGSDSGKILMDLYEKQEKWEGEQTDEGKMSYSDLQLQEIEKVYFKNDDLKIDVDFQKENDIEKEIEERNKKEEEEKNEVSGIQEDVEENSKDEKREKEVGIQEGREESEKGTESECQDGEESFESFYLDAMLSQCFSLDPESILLDSCSSIVFNTLEIEEENNLGGSNGYHTYPFIQRNVQFESDISNSKVSIISSISAHLALCSSYFAANLEKAPNKKENDKPLVLYDKFLTGSYLDSFYAEVSLASDFQDQVSSDECSISLTNGNLSKNTTLCPKSSPSTRTGRRSSLRFTIVRSKSSSVKNAHRSEEKELKKYQGFERGKSGGWTKQDKWKKRWNLSSSPKTRTGRRSSPRFTIARSKSSSVKNAHRSKENELKKYQGFERGKSGGWTKQDKWKKRWNLRNPQQGSCYPSHAQDKIHLAKAKFRIRSHMNGGGKSDGQCQNGKGSNSDDNHNRDSGGSNNGKRGGGGNNNGSRDDGNGNNNNRRNKGQTGGDKGNTSDRNEENDEENPNSEGNKDGSQESDSNLTLPRPHLDEETIQQRRDREQQFLEEERYRRPPFNAGGIDAAIEMKQVVGKTTDYMEHGAISNASISDIIGTATYGLPMDISQNMLRKFNICLTHAMHDLSLSSPMNENCAAGMESCDICLILSHLLKHLAQSETYCHAIGKCNPCTQMFNLILWHVQLCIDEQRQKSRKSRSDLCYKVCKYSNWLTEKLSHNQDRLLEKIKKYCAKVLATNAEEQESEKDIDEGALACALPDLMGDIHTGSSPASQTSTARLSLSGNIIASPENDEDEPLVVTSSASVLSDHIQTHQVEPGQLAHGMTVMPANPIVPTTGPLSGAESTVGESATFQGDGPGHARLVRKPSTRNRGPVIPSPIVEERFPQDSEAPVTMMPRDNRDDTIEMIYKLYGQGPSPYETLRTYGTTDRVESLPVDNMHDVEQFHSLWLRPKGVPGIGEVVFGYPSQLKKVARFWEKKREECENTQYCPYHHLEEGVILAEHKDKFRLLHTRYQKHQQWERVAHLGNGMSGKCHLAIDLTTNAKFCCKKIHLLRYEEEELSLWSELHHQHIVRLYGAIRHGVKVYIFSEFIDGGSLTACINQQKLLGRRLSHWSAINYFRQLLFVLAYLQSKNLLHEDIKGDNILLRQNSTEIVVTDFGTSRRLRDPKELKHKSPVGSPTHWSPEKASMEGHGFPSDLWAAVCVLVHMLSGDPPWVKRYMNKAAILNYVIYVHSPPMQDVPDNVQALVKDLIQRGFVVNPDHRPSASELLQHPAFSVLDDGTPETYYSTLVSQAQFLNRQIKPEDNNQTNEIPDKDNKPTISGSNILFSKEIPVGNYQESDKRLDAMSRKDTPDSSGPEGGQTSSNRGQSNPTSTTPFESNNENQVQAEETVEAVIGKKNDVTSSKAPTHQETTNSNVHELTNPDWDLDQFIPRFGELLPSGDSIKSFLTDTYTSEATFNQVEKTTLQVYMPNKNEAVEEIPNLSIFYVPASEPSQFQFPTAIETSVDTSLHVTVPSPNPLLVDAGNRSFKCQLSDSDCSSSELFGSGSLEPIKKNESMEAERTSTITPSQSQLFSTSFQPSSGSSSQSIVSPKLQQKKPGHLKLNVSVSRSATPESSSPNPAEKELNKSFKSDLTSTPHRPGTGTSSSTGSFFQCKSVHDEQERQLKEFQIPSPDSPTGRLYDDPPITEVEEMDTATMLKNLQVQIDPTPRDGDNKLKFFNEDQLLLFDARVDFPVVWKHFLDEVRSALLNRKYKHFLFQHMDGSLVDFYQSFSSSELMVVALDTASMRECWCQQCLTV